MDETPDRNRPRVLRKVGYIKEGTANGEATGLENQGSVMNAGGSIPLPSVVWALGEYWLVVLGWKPSPQSNAVRVRSS
jgi:hypothetical protein